MEKIYLNILINNDFLCKIILIFSFGNIQIIYKKIIDFDKQKKYNEYKDNVIVKGDGILTNILDYVKWRGDISFNNSPVNEVDALVFCELAYIHFDDLVSSDISAKGIPFETLADKYYSLHYNKNKLGAIIPTEQIQELLKITASSVRFSTVCVRGFTNEVDTKSEKQFCAMCFDIDKNTTVVTYRGTDDTIIGWKEDFNMAFFTPIPAQKQGQEYLESVILQSPKKTYYVAGHSKGGNLAVYSALTVSDKLQEKIEKVYSFDGPGFRDTFVNQVKDNPVVERVVNILPEGAIIGAIFDLIGEKNYISSRAKGLYQHDGFNWALLAREFTRVKGPSKSSLDFHNNLEKWVSQLSEKEKIQFVDALYKFCTVNESTTLTDIASDKLKFLLGVFKVDEQTRKLFVSSLSKLIFKKESNEKSENSEKEQPTKVPLKDKLSKISAKKDKKKKKK